MTDTLTRPDAGIVNLTDEDQEPGDSEAAHIVRTEPGENAAAKVLEARIYGYPVEALCGHKFVPQKDPKALPVCSKCKEIYEMERSINENLHERPNEA